jgi:hypothetical protein
VGLPAPGNALARPDHLVDQPPRAFVP